MTLTFKVLLNVFYLPVLLQEKVLFSLNLSNHSNSPNYENYFDSEIYSIIEFIIPLS